MEKNEICIYRYFKNNQEEFMKNYHVRSNAESGFFMIKQRFSDSVMLKDPISQTNEILCKVLCHNLCVLAQELYLSNIEINFKYCNACTRASSTRRGWGGRAA